MLGFTPAVVRSSTLRTLSVMHDGKMRAAYDVAIAQTDFTAKRLFGTEAFDPIKANPYRQGEQKNLDELKPQAVKEIENRAGLRLLERALLAFCPKKPNAKPAPKSGM